MKKAMNKVLAIVMILALCLLTGCTDELSSSSSVVDKSVKQSEEEETEEETDEETEGVEVDAELGIDYPRPSGSPSLKNGSSGDEVCWLQAALNKAMAAGIIVDGAFGNATAAKVIEFQSRCGISADGVVGKGTIQALVDVISGEKELPDPPKPTDPPREAYQPPVSYDSPANQQSSSRTYVLNTNTHKFHYQSCSSVDKMKDKNKQYYTGTREEVIAMGYDPCQRCCP